MESHQQIIDTLRIFAHRTEFERVDEAVCALRPFGDETVVALADALDDPDDYFRLIALEVLYEWNGDTEPALPAMIRALNDPDRIVRIAAVGPVALHVAKAKDAVPVLMKWLDGDDEHSKVTGAALMLRIESSRHDDMMSILAEGTSSDA